jgi:hypothetical protein
MEAKVVDARNENRVLFRGTEKDAREHVERNFPRAHVDPASAPDKVLPDVYVVTDDGKTMYLGPEEETPWSKVGEE